MEQGEREQFPEFTIEQLLMRVREGQMLQFTEDGFRLFEYVETGETQLHSMDVGETEHIFRVAVKEPMLQAESADLADLFKPAEPYRYNDGRIADEIGTEEFKAWLENLVGPEEVRAAAVKELERRETEGDDETIPCTNCKGAAR